ncbi:SDR family oxidoreductase [Candidatus Woesearchaeota archaeon]|nr:SDR family oxidoreductase [Candidatus Woesearchaeota archaeon]
MKYIVTGGAGFIGSHIVEELVQQGKEVVIIDNFFTGKKENISPFLEKVKVVKGSVEDKKLLSKTIEEGDIILHQAALRSVPSSFENPEAYNNVNINGTFHVLEVAHEKKADRVVFASSSSVYGDSKICPQQENLPPSPKSPYALTKYAGEIYCKIFYEYYGLKTIALRYFNVFGPRQDPHSQYAALIPLFIEAVAQNRPPAIHWDGNQSRDFTYVKNVVRANLAAAHTKKGFGEVFNVADGKSVSVNEVLLKINAILGKNVKGHITGTARAGDIRKTQGDPGKAKKILNYVSKYSFDDGLKETIKWYKASHG